MSSEGGTSRDTTATPYGLNDPSSTNNPRNVGRFSDNNDSKLRRRTKRNYSFSDGNGNARNTIRSESKQSDAAVNYATHVTNLNGEKTKTRTTSFSDNKNGVPNGQQQITEDLDRQCWICFANLKDDFDQGQPIEKDRWVMPCRCRGTTKWVHQQCLQRWVDEKQRGDLLVKVACDRCRTDYRILYPPAGTVIFVLERMEHLTQKICPLGAALLLSGAIYWCAVTSGAIMVFVSVGHRAGLRLMEKADPIFLLLSLPMLPISLLFLDSLPQYSDGVVGVLARATLKDADGTLQQRLQAQKQRRRPASVVFCEAMALPLIGRVLGDWLFGGARQIVNQVRQTGIFISSQLGRTVLGAGTFLFVRALARIYLNYGQLRRQTYRTILDYHVVDRISGHVGETSFSRDSNRPRAPDRNA